MEETTYEEDQLNIDEMDKVNREEIPIDEQYYLGDVNEEIPGKIEEKKKGRIAPFIIGIIIGLVIGVIFSPYFLEVYTVREPPIYNQYDKYEGEDKIVYKNEALKVTITITPAYDYYQAEWIDIYDQSYLEGRYSPTELYDLILMYAERLSENQLKWFEYLLKNIVK